MGLLISQWVSAITGGGGRELVTSLRGCDVTGTDDDITKRLVNSLGGGGGSVMSRDAGDVMGV